MPRLKLTLEYDGTDFVGWQVQPNGRSVQATVEAALSTLLKVPTSVSAAGRTDSGVHAAGQVISFFADMSLPKKAYVKGLSSLLPDDVAVVDAEEVRDDFDPRRWSLGKRYRYVISNRPARSPLRRRTHWEIFSALDVAAMTQAAPLLVGRHDFSAFRAADCAATHPVREVKRIAIDAQDGDIAVTIDGTAFLKHMVRNITGTLVDVGRRKQPPGWAGEVLASRDRMAAGPTAPAHGLTLVHVLYGDGPRVQDAAAVEPAEVEDE